MRVITDHERLTLSDASSGSWLLAGAILLVGLFFAFNGLAIYLGFTRGHLDAANKMLLVGSCALALGLWLIHVSPNLQTVFDPSRNRVLIAKKRLLFSSPPQEYSFQELTRLEIGVEQEVPSPETKDRYLLRLVTVEGKRIPLCHAAHKSQRPYEDALVQTRDFLRSYG
ncbi:MAG: hypothetical protein HOP19_10060, partial [Acidobacteria bacterium]|nr:hypothetical protein [Acidobacteriota bacterium]